MADRIKGITIELDGNTTKLSKALEGVNKDIKNTKASLKDVDKLLKLDPGNIELLKQKEDLLNKAVGETKEKLGTLKDALAQMDANGVDKTSTEYQNLQREIIQTSDELKKLEKAASESNATIAKIGETAKGVAEGAGKVANATKGLSTAAAGVVGGLGAMALKAAESADNLNTMAKQSGFSTEELQKMQYAAERVDVSVETITGAAEKMKAKIKTSEESFTAMGVAVRDANGEYRDTESIFYDVVSAIGQIENETERDIAAMDIFGKSAKDLAGILDDGGKSLKELGEEAANKGLIIPQEDLDQANELNDLMDELKATLSGSFGKAAISSLKALAPLFQSAANAVQKFAQWLSGLSPTTIKVIAIIAGLIAVISPIASTIASIGTAISVLAPVISAATTAISAATAATTAAATAAGAAAAPIMATVGPILAVVAAVAAVIAIGVAIYKNWDTIKEKAGQLKDVVSEKFNNIKEKGVEMWNTLKENSGPALEELKKGTKETLGSMKKAFEENGGGIKGLAAGMWEGVKGSWKTGFNTLDTLTGGKLTEIKDAFNNKFGDIISEAANWGKEIIQKLIDGISAMIEKLKETVGNIVSWIKDKLSFWKDDSSGSAAGKAVSNNLGAMASRAVPGTNVTVNYNNAALSSMLESVNKSIAANRSSSNVTVVLEGDAQGLFKVIKQQNKLNTLATGRNALAY